MESLKGKRIFISGGAGVIGQEVVKLLSGMGSIIMVGDKERIPRAFPNNIIYRQGDLNYITQVELDFFDPEIFIHLAASFERSNETYDHWEENFWNNVRLSNYLMGLIRNCPNIKRVVNASSYLIYDKNLYQFNKKRLKPFRLNENHSINPRNLTGLAKLSHEVELKFLSNHKSDKFISVSARIFRGYGKNSRDIISRWVRQLLQNQKIIVYNQEGYFDYIYAEDSAKGLIKLAQSDLKGVINLGTGRSRQVKDIIQILLEYFPKAKIEYTVTKEMIEASEADISTLEAKLNWKPERNLEDTIPEIIDFEKSNNEESFFINNVLITSISKKIPLINSVKGATKKINEKIKLIGSDNNLECLGQYFVDEFWHWPKLEDISTESLISECLKRNISYIIPTRDDELLFFSKRKDLFKINGINIMVSDYDSVINNYDKLKFKLPTKVYDKLKIQCEIDINRINSKKIVVKERYGSGSKNIGLNLSKEEALNYSKRLINPIFQPFEQGIEVSVDAYICLDHKIKGIIIRKRNLVVNGESQITETIIDEELTLVFRKIIESLNLYGHINLQAFLIQKNEIKIIECNPRFGGASTLSVKAGLDSFYWFILESIGQNLNNYPFVKPTKTLKQIRFSKDYYL